MRILISNDDGVDAPGILALVHAVKHMGEVTVVAPDRQRSASSHGISLHRPLYVEERTIAPEIKAYAASGTPVDCVKWAIVMLGQSEPFDIMLSGINEGFNLATDVLYSGTVAAAGEAALQRIKSVAFSLAGPPFPFQEAAVLAASFVRRIMNFNMPSDTFLNVNLPAGGVHTGKWCATKLGARGYKNEFHKVLDEHGRTYYRHSGEELEEIGGSDTDVATIRRNDISVTPLRYHFTNDGFIDSLKSWIET